MDPTVIVALIGLAGSLLVVVLNHKLTNQVKLQGREIVWLKTLVRLVVSEFERSHLRNLAADRPFTAEVKRGSTFEWEMRHLVTLGLVARHPNKGIGMLFAHEGRQNVKEYLYITDEGRDYLRIVDETKGR